MADQFAPITVTYDCTPREHAEAVAFLSRPVGSPQVGPIVSPASSFGRGIFGWVLFIVMAVALFVMLNGRKRWNLPDAQAVSRDQFAALVVFLTSLVFIAAASVTFRRARHAPPRWHGQIRYTFAEDALHIERPGRQDRYAWEEFLKLGETLNLFVLQTDAKHGLVIPKRLFGADASHVHAVREVVQRHLIRVAIPQAHGFEVVPPP